MSARKAALNSYSLASSPMVCGINYIYQSLTCARYEKTSIVFVDAASCCFSRSKYSCNVMSNRERESNTTLAIPPSNHSIVSLLLAGSF